MVPLKITFLEMLSPQELRPGVATDPPLEVHAATVRQWEVNRFLYLLVGADWEWTDKRGWSAAQWRDYVTDKNLYTFLAFCGGSIAGYFELKREPGGSVEVAILGLTPHFVGRGFGRALVTRALEEGWKLGATRVWLHTCNRDHPAALHNYMARGLKVFRMETDAG